jgi:hypothetical protein
MISLKGAEIVTSSKSLLWNSGAPSPLSSAPAPEIAGNAASKITNRASIFVIDMLCAEKVKV